LFSLFQKANATVVEIFDQLEAKGIAVPQQSRTEYEQALLLADGAKNLLQEGNYSEASSKVIQALQNLKETLYIVYTTIHEQPTETETTLEKTAQLRSSISRYREQLLSLENLTRQAATSGYNTTELEAKIAQIKSLLSNASSNVDQKRFETASANLAEAKTLSDTLANALSNIAIDLKVQRLEAYIAQAEIRLAAIRERAKELANTLPSSTVTASLAALSNAETSLSNAKEYLEQELINQTLNALSDSKTSEIQAVEILKPAASSLDSSTSSPTASNSLTSSVRFP
jgi:DNA repair exonuclease SbcCD ATPase subunit